MHEFGPQYLISLRMVQGSRMAPLCWDRLAALLMRLTQSLFEPDRLRLACFLDDHTATIVSTKRQRMMTVAIIILTWEALGLSLAYHKGQRGPMVVWV